MQTETYEHHGNIVYVQPHLKGKHREHCLCFSCDKFKPDDSSRQCLVAAQVYDTCVEYGIVTPVWECPHFGLMEDVDETDSEPQTDIEGIIEEMHNGRSSI